MRSVIFDVLDNKVIMAQSSPRVLKSGLNKEIMVTYLAGGKSHLSRLGFLAKITDLIDDYEIVSKVRVNAIVIKKTGAPEPLNIRLHFRLTVPSDSDLQLLIGDEKVNLIDISIGGAKIGLTGAKPLRPHDRVKLSLGFDNREFKLDAEVLRIWFPGVTDSNKDSQLAAIQFLNTGRQFQHLLGEKIFTIQRQLEAADKMQSRW